MSWGSADHSHDYAERNHYHYRSDVSDVAEQYHDHHDLKETISGVREDCNIGYHSLREEIEGLRQELSRQAERIAELQGKQNETVAGERDA